MVHVKSFYNKNIIKYGIMFVLIFTVICILFSFYKNVNFSLKQELRKKEYNTIFIGDIDIKEENIEQILKKYNINIKKIKYNNSTGQYEITFGNIDDLRNNLDIIKENFTNVHTYSLDVQNYEIARNIFAIVLIIIIILLFILIISFMMDFIFNLEKNIALYKLIGYSNKNIIRYLKFAIYTYFLILFIISIFISLIIFKTFFSKIIFLSFIKIVDILSLSDYFYIYIAINTALFIAFIRVTSRINNINPILLVKKY